MEAQIINYTPRALDLLLFTKNTRLEMTPGLMSEIAAWPVEKKAAEIAYMAKTIRSSWEFVNVTFLVSGLTRPTAQQVTRTRHGKYAMQSQRVADVSTMAVECPFKKGTEAYATFMHAARVAHAAYKDLLNSGESPQTARGVLPQNVTSNLVVQYDLSTFVNVIAARESLRADDQYAELAATMKEQVLELWPWTAPFFESRFDMAIGTLTALAKELGVTPGRGQGWEIAKVIDLLRKA